ncbi:hypothetical protein HGRIS_013467 [Hohenbuehelia grisea]|uniref:Uncharacterized protein n=1 Tax=Hohenbuehelia grisea TaxID=104357 RepID=A0ABR3IVL2_9AGAR
MSNTARVKVSSGWLQGKTVRKGSGLPANAALQSIRSASSTRSTTPATGTTAGTSSIFGSGFGGGVKDASGRVSEFFSMEDQCPVCKSDRYLNPKLRILVSSCYHKMFVPLVSTAQLSVRDAFILPEFSCPLAVVLVLTAYNYRCESCIDRLFTLGPAPCPAPGCTKILRKLAFIPQTFEDLGVEKEVAIRRRVAKEQV